MFNLLYSSTNQQLFKKNLCNQSRWWITSIANDSHPTFSGAQREWDTKEGTVKNALCVQQYLAKGTYWPEAVKKIKPVASTIVKLKASVIQSVNQSFSQVVS